MTAPFCSCNILSTGKSSNRNRYTNSSSGVIGSSCWNNWITATATASCEKPDVTTVRFESRPKHTQLVDPPSKEIDRLFFLQNNTNDVELCPFFHCIFCLVSLFGATGSFMYRTIRKIWKYSVTSHATLPVTFSDAMSSRRPKRWVAAISIRLSLFTHGNRNWKFSTEIDPKEVKDVNSKRNSGLHIKQKPSNIQQKENNQWGEGDGDGIKKNRKRERALQSFSINSEPHLRERRSACPTSGESSSYFSGGVCGLRRKLPRIRRGLINISIVNLSGAADSAF